MFKTLAIVTLSATAILASPDLADDIANGVGDVVGDIKSAGEGVVSDLKSGASRFKSDFDDGQENHDNDSSNTSGASTLAGGSMVAMAALAVVSQLI